MIDDLKPYAVYKDSGMAWLGEIPEHWSIRRAKGLFVKMNRPSHEDDDVVTCFRDGTVTLRRKRRLRGYTESIKEIGYQGIRRGDLVIHAMDAFAGAIGVSDSDGKGTPVYSVCQPQEEVNAYFYAHLVREMARSQWILALAKGIRERSTDFRFDTFASSLVLLPPLEEQTTIATFLDHADRRIRRYIRSKQKLIKLLEEQKQVVINEAVIRGIAPNGNMKISGVEWLGEIPEHWHLIRLKRLVFRIDQGVSPQAENYLANGNSWGVLKSGCVNRGVFKEKEHKRLPNSFNFDPILAVCIGDVLVSRASGSPNLVGSVGRVYSLDYQLILSDKIFRPIFTIRVDPDFMVMAMNSRYYRHQVEKAISGAEGLANNLPLSSLRSFLFVIPPKDEQKMIVEIIHKKVENLTITAQKAEREISLLQEFRTRLISDVVTGKLDVREAAAKLPTEINDLEPLDEDLDEQGIGLEDDLDPDATPEDDAA